MEAASAELLAQQTGTRTPRTGALCREGATVGDRQGECLNRRKKTLIYFFFPLTKTLELNEEPR